MKDINNCKNPACTSEGASSPVGVTASGGKSTRMMARSGARP